jgi:hypothetical protein
MEKKNNELSYSWGEFSLNRHFTKGASPPIVYRPELSIEDAEKSYFHTVWKSWFSTAEKGWHVFTGHILMLCLLYFINMYIYIIIYPFQDSWVIETRLEQGMHMEEVVHTPSRWHAGNYLGKNQKARWTTCLCICICICIYTYMCMLIEIHSICN